MDKFGLMGFPTAGTLSPGLFRQHFGGRWEYDEIETPSFDEAWRRFVEEPYKAVNVTAPFKEPACARADIQGPECKRIKAANILIKTPEGIVARNSDYLAVRKIIEDSLDRCTGRTAAVIGFGGAGKAALAAAEDVCGPAGVRLYRHDGISGGVKADIIVYTLPKAVPGIEKLECSVLVEANYKTPCLSDGPYIYVPGTEWLRLQGAFGYPLMTEGLSTSSSSPKTVISLTGFMGSGKSSVGRALSKRLGLRFVDLDEEVVRRSGRSIASIFEDGEPAFRAIELDTLKTVLSRGTGDSYILSLGGGTLTVPEARELVLSRTTSFYLKASAATLAERAGRNTASRPLFGADFANRLAGREPDYEKAAFTIDTEGKTPQSVADEIAAVLKKD